MILVVYTTSRPLCTQERDRVPILQEAVLISGRSGWSWKISPTPGFEFRNVQPVMSWYTDYVKPATAITYLQQNNTQGFEGVFPEHLSLELKSWGSRLQRSTSAVHFTQTKLFSAFSTVLSGLTTSSFAVASSIPLKLRFSVE
jgi:hypothetical protein